MDFVYWYCLCHVGEVYGIRDANNYFNPFDYRCNYACSTVDTCLQFCLVIRKRMLQNYKAITKKCYLFTDINLWISNKCMEFAIEMPNPPIFKGLTFSMRHIVLSSCVEGVNEFLQQSTPCRCEPLHRFRISYKSCRNVYSVLIVNNPWCTDGCT